MMWLPVKICIMCNYNTSIELQQGKVLHAYRKRNNSSSLHQPQKFVSTSPISLNCIPDTFHKIFLHFLQLSALPKHYINISQKQYMKKTQVSYEFSYSVSVHTKHTHPHTHIDILGIKLKIFSEKYNLGFEDIVSDGVVEGRSTTNVQKKYLCGI